ncbi:MAG: helix-turn-helix domain-containing protein [Trueperaceae bacterium]|nr:helix-turn-helix domain-containing protein [Trueperaceae bacterium]
MNESTPDTGGRPPGRNFGPEMRALRVEHAISQTYLARVLGVSQPYVARVEKGVRGVTPRQERRFRLAIARIAKERARG